MPTFLYPLVLIPNAKAEVAAIAETLSVCCELLSAIVRIFESRPSRLAVSSCPISLVVILK